MEERMAEQKIVQHRRDSYSNFAPSKIKPGEIVIIQSGDPDSSSGQAVYVCIAAGNVKRLATQDELSTYDQAASTSAAAAEQAKTAAQTAQTTALEAQSAAEASQTAAEAAQTAAEASQTAAETAQTEAQSASQTAQTAAEAAQTAAGASQTAQTAAETAATNAQTALSTMNARADEINAAVLAQRTIETGSSTTDGSGIAYVYLTEDFKEALGANNTAYKVFLQEEGEGKVFVSEKTDTFFSVSGTEGLAFSWMIILQP